jgi:hypothetical protein
MYQVFSGVKSSSPDPIFVFLRKATRFRSQNRFTIAIAMLSAGAVAHIDQQTIQIREVTGNRLLCADQVSPSNTFQL